MPIQRIRVRVVCAVDELEILFDLAQLDHLVVGFVSCRVCFYEIKFGQVSRMTCPLLSVDCVRDLHHTCQMILTLALTKHARNSHRYRGDDFYDGVLVGTCPNPRHSERLRFCPEHACTATCADGRPCVNERKKGSLLCHEHMCAIEGCERRRNVDPGASVGQHELIYCAVHTSVYDMSTPPLLLYLTAAFPMPSSP